MARPATAIWFNGSNSLGFGINPTFTLAVGSYSIDLVVTDTNGLTDSDPVAIQINEPVTDPVIYMSFTTNTTLPGGAGTAADEDIVSYDTATGTWSILAARMKSFSDRPPMACVQSSIDMLR